jgi:hypothetical protein
MLTPYQAAHYLRRIDTRGTPEIRAALESGRISAWAARELVKKHQASLRKETLARSLAAARVIRDYLDTNPGRVDLEAIRRRLRQSPKVATRGRLS